MPDPEVFDKKTIYSKEYIQDFIYREVPVQEEVEPISLNDEHIKGPLPPPTLRRPGFKIVDPSEESSFEKYQRLVRESRERRAKNKADDGPDIGDAVRGGRNRKLK